MDTQTVLARGGGGGVGGGDKSWFLRRARFYLSFFFRCALLLSWIIFFSCYFYIFLFFSFSFTYLFHSFLIIFFLITFFLFTSISLFFEDFILVLFYRSTCVVLRCVNCIVETIKNLEGQSLYVLYSRIENQYVLFIFTRKKLTVKGYRLTVAPCIPRRPMRGWESCEFRPMGEGSQLGVEWDMWQVSRYANHQPTVYVLL